MFSPPFCPSPDCLAHRHPEAVPRGFFVREGSYRPKCRPKPVPRFRCKVCRRGFSQQTFRMDYCDNKPYLNAPLLELLSSGKGLRASGRELSLSRRCVQLKARKMARHLRRVNRDLGDRIPVRADLIGGALKSFESGRVARAAAPGLERCGSNTAARADRGSAVAPSVERRA